jgi:ribose 5-phosphate isomerase A
MSTISTAPDAVAEENAVEAAKRLAARRAVADHFRPEFMHVGIGSGSTIKYVVEAIADALAAHHGPAADLALATTSGDAVPLAQRRRRASSTHGAYGIAFVPTGYQSRETIVEAGLHPVALDALEDAVRLDVAFDGADEVDAHLNCIKGGGACLFQEKLVAMRARKWICVAGASLPTTPMSPSNDGQTTARRSRSS